MPRGLLFRHVAAPFSKHTMQRTACCTAASRPRVGSPADVGQSPAILVGIDPSERAGRRKPAARSAGRVWDVTEAVWAKPGAPPVTTTGSRGGAPGPRVVVAGDIAAGSR